MKAGQSLIELKNVTARVRNRWLLQETSWKIEQGSQWAVIGPNGAGKSTLAGLLTGEVPVVKGTTARYCRPHEIGSISFEMHEHLMAREERFADARHFAGRLKGGTTVLGILRPDSVPKADTPAAQESFARVTRQMGLGRLLKSRICDLSSGESRKVLLARAMLGNPRLLILDEPYEGLDAASGKMLAQTIDSLIESGVNIVMITHQLDKISPLFTHVLCVKSGRVVTQGPRDSLLTPAGTARLYGGKPRPRRRLPAPPAPFSGRDIIRVENATVAYGETVVLNRLDWTFKEGENWALLGPNGAGKSTLVALITGDHPQAYANRVRLFGRPRGSGESIWEIKRRIGLMSPELQIRYRKDIPVSAVVRSGFFDSVGLYRRCSPDQVKIADQWLEICSLTPKRDRRFSQLSYGERRLVLLARAMVKSPELLVMDEPCQGLDPARREQLRDIVEDACSRSGTNLLYITHRPDEIPDCITHVLELSPGVPGGQIRRQV